MCCCPGLVITVGRQAGSLGDGNDAKGRGGGGLNVLRLPCVEGRREGRVPSSCLSDACTTPATNLLCTLAASDPCRAGKGLGAEAAEAGANDAAGGDERCCCCCWCGGLGSPRALPRNAAAGCGGASSRVVAAAPATARARALLPLRAAPLAVVVVVVVVGRPLRWAAALGMMASSQGLGLCWDGGMD